MPGSGKRLRKLVPRRYRRLFDLLASLRNWYVVVFVLLAAGLVNYVLTGFRVPPLAFVPPQYMEQSIGETVTLAILLGFGVYFVLLTEGSRRSSHEGWALAISLIAAFLLVIWYLIILALAHVI